MSTTPDYVLEYFHKQTIERDPSAVTVNHLDHFENGIAPYESGQQPMFDTFANVLAPNFNSDVVLENGIIVPAIKSSRNRAFCEQFHEQRDKRPIVVIVPHPSIASPFVVARALNLPVNHEESFDEEIAAKFFSIVGPRPMTYDYSTPLGNVSPYSLGTMLNNLLLTGTNTGSIDDAPDEVADWLKEQGTIMKANLDELMEPKEKGNNNALIVCPSGKIGQPSPKKVKEFLPRSYRFAASLADRAVFWPIGVFDRVLVDPKNPSSLVYFNPDGIAHPANFNDEDDIYTLHLKALELASSGIGSIKMQTRFDAAGQGIKRKVRSYSKK